MREPGSCNEEVRECRRVGKDLRRILEDSGKGYAWTIGFKHRADNMPTMAIWKNSVQKR